MTVTCQAAHGCPALRHRLPPIHPRTPSPHCQPTTNHTTSPSAFQAHTHTYAPEGLLVAVLDLERVPLPPELLVSPGIRQAGRVHIDGTSTVHLAQPPLQRSVANAQRARIGVCEGVRRLGLDGRLVHLAHLGWDGVGCVGCWWLRREGASASLLPAECHCPACFHPLKPPTTRKPRPPFRCQRTPRRGRRRCRTPPAAPAPAPSSPPGRKSVVVRG